MFLNEKGEYLAFSCPNLLSHQQSIRRLAAKVPRTVNRIVIRNRHHIQLPPIHPVQEAVEPGQAVA
jgi:hypothetical protein